MATSLVLCAGCGLQIPTELDPTPSIFNACSEHKRK